MTIQYSEPLEHGQFASQTVLDPGANTQFAFTFSTQFKRQLIAVSFNFSADANAADRHIRITLDDGTNVMYVVPSGLVHTANFDVLYTFAVGAGTTIGVTAIANLAPLPYPFAAPPLSVLRSLVTNMQVGDAFTNIVITSQIWIP